MTKQIIYCRFCDRLTKEEVEEINKKSIDEVSSTEDCEDCLACWPFSYKGMAKISKRIT